MTTRKAIDIDEVTAYIQACSPETRIYIGTDSVRQRVRGAWVADYTTVIVVHIDGSHGCKVFGETVRMPSYDSRKDRPALRLMQEVYLAADLYLKLADVLADRYVEVHLDVNTDILHGSSCVVSQAMGYIKGVCGVEPKFKPDAFAASYAADRYIRYTSGVSTTLAVA